MAYSASYEKPIEDKRRLYESMRRYLLPEYSLGGRGYPRMDATGRVTIQQCDKKAPPSLPNPSERHCYRCYKRFVINPNGTFTPSERCTYHEGLHADYVGGVWQGKHTCCKRQKGSAGCAVAQSHVHRENRIHDVLGYVKSQSSALDEKQWNVYCLDCEMIYTSHGLELAHVTLVDPDLSVIMDELIKPDHPVVEWNTKYSGITEVMMRPVTTTLADVQQRLLALINDKTILVGHSPQFDLTALKLVHSSIIDTSEIFMDGRYKKSLKDLVKEKLGRTIQTDKSGGHDSKEDALACMELLMWKIRQDQGRRY